ncbi:CDP-alcohol phosphatidyltransferase family protein [Propionibacterium australiense]|uniref:CDP-alcohol phosphatidyltransferase n=1 Tax=Propionibacterium australiense TaxID=119981 RepID=A0A383S634_9ACTN|nr:CDP-alcohol phosphatidyltransferase family protein [Propionibacterium australiense]RLP08986.1 CDP-alcohol phosphatidyltransferase [Propionibacterium australiense]RLP09079.1 CDP-alcohol phosphatidyltransferase [Propionibacterium australiense]SYZ33450.1 CDP-alcohol phosphatidyltransferase [Propionibacterium australiense]VEH91821.1 sn-1,2-diacylglycerol ethanolamine- and cholinephosphotranferases [Propionibacterium australiense]
MSATKPEAATEAWGQRFSRYRAELDAAQKPGNGVPAYTRWINRRGARLVAAFAAATGWTPNNVSAMSFLLSAVGMAVLVASRPAAWVGVVVAVFLALGYLFDSADGQVSRVTHASSRTGEWIDHVADAFRSPAIHLCLAITTVIHTDRLWFALVAVVYAWITSGQFLSQILAEQFVRAAGRKQTRGGTMRSFILLPTDPGTLCWSFVLYGLGAPFIVVYTLLAGIAVCHSLLSLSRRYRDLRALDAAAREG